MNLDNVPWFHKLGPKWQVKSVWPKFNITLESTSLLSDVFSKTKKFAHGQRTLEFDIRQMMVCIFANVKILQGAKLVTKSSKELTKGTDNKLLHVIRSKCNRHYGY